MTYLLTFSLCCSSFNICMEFTKSSICHYMLIWSHHFESFTVATVTWSTVTEYLCPQMTSNICSFYCNLSHSLFVIYFRFCNTTDVTIGSGTVYPSGAPEFTPDVRGFRAAQSLVFCVVFCRSLFVLLSFSFWPLCFLIYRFWIPLWYLQSLQMTTDVMFLLSYSQSHPFLIQDLSA